MHHNPDTQRRMARVMFLTRKYEKEEHLNYDRAFRKAADYVVAETKAGKAPAIDAPVDEATANGTNALPDWLESAMGAARRMMKDGKDADAAYKIALRAALAEIDKVSEFQPGLAVGASRWAPGSLVGLAKEVSSFVAPAVEARPAQIDLKNYGGRNWHERALSFVRAQPGAEKMDEADVFARASAIVRAERAAGRITGTGVEHGNVGFDPSNPHHNPQR